MACTGRFIVLCLSICVGTSLGVEPPSKSAVAALSRVTHNKISRLAKNYTETLNQNEGKMEGILENNESPSGAADLIDIIYINQ